jgi:hypothetical protein
LDGGRYGGNGRGRNKVIENCTETVITFGVHFTVQTQNTDKMRKRQKARWQIWINSKYW